jgi:hypothetical protein
VTTALPPQTLKSMGREEGVSIPYPVGPPVDISQVQLTTSAALGISLSSYWSENGFATESPGHQIFERERPLLHQVRLPHLQML